MIGKRIGRIQIRGLLGQGGMGEVYEGFDEKLERRVAVKSLDQSNRLNELTKARFHQEARLLSRLDHPNICKIYDVLEHGGHDVLVLEFVEGQTLSDVMSNEIGAREKFDIALQVTSALVAAHAEGVVHRDLKPDNVMVGDDGVVKVLDFGIAHSVNGTTVSDATLPGTEPFNFNPVKTIDGSVIGTPRYMSPEQARGEPVTPASDLYSLGLLFQRLFTGGAPYHSGRSQVELLIEVGEGRTLSVSGLPKPLTDLIADLKALNPAERPSAVEVRQRLQWIGKSKQRRVRRVVAALILVTAIAGSVKYTVDLNRERETAIAARAGAENLVTFLLDDLADELDPLGNLSVLETVSRRAIEYYEGVSVEDSHEAVFNQGRAFGLVADVLIDQGELDQAEVAARRAHELHRLVINLDPENRQWRQELVHDVLRLADVAWMRNENEESLAFMMIGHDIAERLVRENPENIDSLETLSEVHYSLGLHYLELHPQLSLKNFSTAALLVQQLIEKQPDETDHTYFLAVLKGQGVGQAHWELGNKKEAYQSMSEAYRLYHELIDRDPSNARWLFGLSWEDRRLGQCHIEMGDFEKAKLCFREAQKIAEKLLEREPRNINWQQGLANDHCSMGDIYFAEKHYSDASASYTRAIKIHKRLLAQEPDFYGHRFDLASDYREMGLIFDETGQHRKSRSLWQKALFFAGPLISNGRAVEPSYYDINATLLIYLGRLREAEPIVSQLISNGYGERPDGEKLVELLGREIED